MKRRQLLMHWAGLMSTSLSLSSTAEAAGTSDMPWAIAQASTGEYDFLMRFCSLPEAFPRSRYPVRLNLFWNLAEPRANGGMPSSAESERMAVFEERLVAATEADDVAMLPLIFTGRGQREYVFFAVSAEAFMRRLSDMPQEDEPYPVEIHRNDDPGWAYYDEALASVSPGEAP